MPLTPALARAAVDAQLAPLWATIQARQAAYLAAHGRYWQGLKLLITTPADGVDATPDNVASHPPVSSGGVPENWTSFLGASLPASLAATIWIDVYDGPNGKGYVATVEGTLGGNTWRRAVQIGPETRFAYPWVQVG